VSKDISPDKGEKRAGTVYLYSPTIIRSFQQLNVGQRHYLISWKDSCGVRIHTKRELKGEKEKSDNIFPRLVFERGKQFQKLRTGKKGGPPPENISFLKEESFHRLIKSRNDARKEGGGR